MIRNITNLIATIVLAYLLSMVLPWWSIMLAAFITSVLIPLKKGLVFFIPFFAIQIYWGAYCYSLSSANDFTLAAKISELLTLGGNPYKLIIATAIIGGIAAGISGVFGKQLSTLFRSE
ncbi:MAG: hypothetical protein CMB99_05885 [Flavobacteriaceae bacterium]|nr:hypothetical protein [Flavobacteriaceae bacterium]|tara:strand:+ start:5938 stop:6294 length:357 start_codon:yes stop_codon:yes gene_type:complete